MPGVEETILDKPVENQGCSADLTRLVKIVEGEDGNNSLSVTILNKPVDIDLRPMHEESRQCCQANEEKLERQEKIQNKLKIKLEKSSEIISQFRQETKANQQLLEYCMQQINARDSIISKAASHEHVGTKEGPPAVCDTVDCGIGEDRRKIVVSKHHGAHILNNAPRQVLAGDINQGGSLVALQRSIFDLTNKAAITAAEVEKVEDTTDTMINKNHEMYAEEIPPALVKTIQAQRAVSDDPHQGGFDEPESHRRDIRRGFDVHRPTPGVSQKTDATPF